MNKSIISVIFLSLIICSNLVNAQLALGTPIARSTTNIYNFNGLALSNNGLVSFLYGNGLTESTTNVVSVNVVAPITNTLGYIGCAVCAQLGQPSYFTSLVANTFAGLLAGTGLSYINSNTFALATLTNTLPISVAGTNQISLLTVSNSLAVNALGYLYWNPASLSASAPLLLTGNTLSCSSCLTTAVTSITGSGGFSVSASTGAVTGYSPTYSAQNGLYETAANAIGINTVSPLTNTLGSLGCPTCWTGTNYNSFYNAILTTFFPYNNIAAGAGISVSGGNTVTNIGVTSLTGSGGFSVSSSNAAVTGYSPTYTAGTALALSAANAFSLLALTANTGIVVTNTNSISTNALIIPTQSAAATTVYVNFDTGSDVTGTGSTAAPFQTIQKAVDSLPTFITKATTIAISCVTTCTDSEAVNTNAHVIVASLVFRAIDLSGNSDYTSGTATDGSTTTLVNTAASWPVNGFVGGNVFVYNGLGAPEIGNIISNTGNTITIGVTWTAPDSTSLYSVNSNVLLTGNPAFNFIAKQSANVQGFQFASTGAFEVEYSSSASGSVTDCVFYPPASAFGAAIVSTTGSSVTATLDYFILANNDGGITASLSSSVVPRQDVFISPSLTTGSTGLYAYLNSGFNIATGTTVDVFKNLATGILTIGDSVAFQEPVQIYSGNTRTYSTSQLANDGAGVPSLQVGNTLVGSYITSAPYFVGNFIGPIQGANTVAFSTATGTTVTANIVSNNAVVTNIYGTIAGSNTVAFSTATGTTVTATTLNGNVVGNNAVYSVSDTAPTLNGNVISNNVVSANLYGNVVGVNTLGANTITFNSLVPVSTADSGAGFTSILVNQLEANQIGIGALSSQYSFYDVQGGASDMYVDFQNVHSGYGAFAQLAAASHYEGFTIYETATNHQWYVGEFNLGPSGENFVVRDQTSSTPSLQIESGAPTNSLYILASGNIQTVGKVSTYNGIATAGIGIVPVYAATSQKSETGADASLLSYTPKALAGNYRICITMDVSAATVATLGWTATWTDSNGHAQSPTNLALTSDGVAAPALTYTAAANSNYNSCETINIDNSATAIVIKTTFAGTSISYKATATVEELV